MKYYEKVLFEAGRWTTTVVVCMIRVCVCVCVCVCVYTYLYMGFPGGANAGDTSDEGLIPRSERSPGGGHGNPLQ